ncbi:MAG: type II toxin-antitoxin system prevent-host-death family antitoxin [Betaproteobacteria bacterium]|nr:type II toxin-antitoxin system prevent-host-death family antitoxin [Betaproteobacteria bacterium]NCA17745.1 type II toxin-antitoxin system prevent-host-death family antitoxin [Betaproteobacteria bacterium]
MASVTIQEAQSTLTELIHRLQTGDEVVITENDRPVARLVLAPQSPPNPPRRLGTMKGSVVSMAPDFDAPLEEFGEYTE